MLLLLKLSCLYYRSAVNAPRLRRISTEVTEITSHLFSVINHHNILNMTKYGCKYKQASITLKFEQVAMVSDDRLLPNSNLVSLLGTPCPLLAGAVYPNYPCPPVPLHSSVHILSLLLTIYSCSLSVSYPHFCCTPQ